MLLHAPLLFSALFFLFLFLFCILYHFLLYYFFFFFFYSFTRWILWFLPRVLLVLPNFSLVLSLFPLILYPNFCSYVEYRSPFPRRCSFISLALVARILKSTIVIVARGGSVVVSGWKRGASSAVFNATTKIALSESFWNNIPPVNLLFCVLHDRIEHARLAPTCDYWPLKIRVVIDIIRLCFYLFILSFFFFFFVFFNPLFSIPFNRISKNHRVLV